MDARLKFFSLREILVARRNGVRVLTRTYFILYGLKTIRRKKPPFVGRFHHQKWLAVADTHAAHHNIYLLFVRQKNPRAYWECVGFAARRREHKTDRKSVV